jgi:hypothetical protein
MLDRIIGYPHEAGIDSPLGSVHPRLTRLSIGSSCKDNAKSEAGL